MMAAAITGGEVLLKNIDYDIVHNTCVKLKENGIVFEVQNNGILVKSDGNIIASDRSTMPYPGFATDLQAQYMTLMTISKGTSIISENLFENRFMHVPELCRMGANIKIEGNNAIVRGHNDLIGTEVMASDLRASVSLLWLDWLRKVKPKYVGYIIWIEVMNLSKKS
jgi:UDP-N-acetylglucosamine 1-carboxyvinyltransferase